MRSSQLFRGLAGSSYSFSASGGFVTVVVAVAGWGDAGGGLSLYVWQNLSE